MVVVNTGSLVCACILSLWSSNCCFLLYGCILLLCCVLVVNLMADFCHVMCSRRSMWLKTIWESRLFWMQRTWWLCLSQTDSASSHMSHNTIITSTAAHQVRLVVYILDRSYWNTTKLLTIGLGKKNYFMNRYRSFKSQESIL